MKLNIPAFTLFIITTFLWSIELTECQQQCNFACTGEYNPVCGEQNQFFRVFTNKCRLDRENSCGANPPWTLVRVGQCP